MYEILIAEDDESIRTNIAFLLIRNGYKTITSENGSHALELAKTKLPDLILSDIKMPLLNGYQFREELLKDPQTESIPFIFLTMKADYEDIRMGMRAGADDYLPKPFRANDLLDTIKMQLLKRQKIQDKFNALGAEIVRNLQHELRTPLVPILGFSQMILQKNNMLTLEEISEMAGMIHNSGNKMLSQIEKFFSYSDLVLLSRDALRIKKTEEQYVLNVKKSIKEYAEKWASLFDRQFDMVLNLKEGYVCISEKHLKNIIDELLQNAFTFSYPGSAIVISAAEKKGKYVIQVTDYGIGMTDEQLKNLIAVSKTSQDYTKEEGNGLGMVIVKKIVDLYGGEIKIASKRGKYTIVKINLRLKKHFRECFHEYEYNGNSRSELIK